jgi:hypothetical protein
MIDQEEMLNTPLLLPESPNTNQKQNIGWLVPEIQKEDIERGRTNNDIISPWFNIWDFHFNRSGRHLEG